MWTPGYWAYSPDDQDYYWVPGTWVQAPMPGYLWTPGYWGWGGDRFVWNEGYWGTHIGFYGGVNYGYGYGGSGYEGGYWNNGAFYYNRSVNNVGSATFVTNVYTKTVYNNVTVNNVSYNGGEGGTTVQPTAEERVAASERHIAPTPEQTQHQHMASTNPALKASVNHGKPTIAATSKPGVFGHGVVGAKAAAPYTRTPGKGPAGANPNPSGGVTHPTYTEHRATPVRENPPPPNPETRSHSSESGGGSHASGAPPKNPPAPKPAAGPKSSPPPKGESGKKPPKD
jgi:hypothetical protein